MKTKRACILLLLPICYLTSCNNIMRKQISKIYRKEPLNSAYFALASKYNEEEVNWFNSTDFTLYLHSMRGDYPIYSYIGEGEERKSDAVSFNHMATLIHSVKYNYTYFGITYFDEVLESEQWLTTSGGSYHYVSGELKDNESYSDYYSIFGNVITAFSKADPLYEEKLNDFYQLTDESTEAQKANCYHPLDYLYSYVDYHKDSYTLSHPTYGEVIIRPRATVSSLKYQKKNKVTSVTFKMRNWTLGFYAEGHHDDTTFEFEFMGSLPLSYIRYVKYYIYSEETSIYDTVYIFSYDELPNDPQTLINKDFSFKHKTGSFGKN